MPGQQYTAEQRNFLSMRYQELSGTRDFIPIIVAEFTDRFPEAQVPNRKTILRQNQKQNTHFTVHNLNSKDSPGQTFSGRPRTARTAASIAAQKALMDRDARKDWNDPNNSPVSTARRNRLGISKSTWSRVVQQEKWHPYKMLKVQNLTAADLPRRVRMCQYLQSLTDNEVARFCFSDEATFQLDGEINTHNVRRYQPLKGSVPVDQAAGRPEHFLYKKSTFTQKVMVFLGIRDNHLFGFTFLEGGKVNGQRYKQLLVRKALPDLRAGNGGSLDQLTWTQDGATSHTTVGNLAYLMNQFNNNVLSSKAERLGGRDWSARSPDMNPLDFGIWGILKARVYAYRPQTMDQLKAKISSEVTKLGQESDLLRRITRSVPARAARIVAANGGYIKN